MPTLLQKDIMQFNFVQIQRSMLKKTLPSLQKAIRTEMELKAIAQIGTLRTVQRFMHSEAKPEEVLTCMEMVQKL